MSCGQQLIDTHYCVLANVHDGSETLPLPDVHDAPAALGVTQIPAVTPTPLQTWYPVHSSAGKHTAIETLL